MPLIQTVSVESATGELAELYDRAKQMRGRVTNSNLLLGSSPALLKQQLDFVEFYSNHESLSGELMACIRMLISEKNDCPYCINLNGGMLVNLHGWTPEQVQVTRRDPQKARLSDKEKAMMLFVLKGVGNSNSIKEQDITILRDHGYTDGEILEALNLGARMSATDILFNAFQIEAQS